MPSILETIITLLETAPRLGADVDEPEGARYIQISDTLAQSMAAALRLFAESLK